MWTMKNPLLRHAEKTLNNCCSDSATRVVRCNYLLFKCWRRSNITCGSSHYCTSCIHEGKKWQFGSTGKREEPTKRPTKGVSRWGRTSSQQQAKSRTLWRKHRKHVRYTLIHMNTGAKHTAQLCHQGRWRAGTAPGPKQHSRNYRVPLCSKLIVKTAVRLKPKSSSFHPCCTILWDSRRWYYKWF